MLSCTVKNPSQSAMENLIRKGKDAGKPLVVAGCVPQGDKNLKDLEGVSVVGVQQIDRVVEVVEETLKGHEVRLLRRSSLPSLDLPKVCENFPPIKTSVGDFKLNHKVPCLYESMLFLESFLVLFSKFLQRQLASLFPLFGHHVHILYVFK